MENLEPIYVGKDQMGTILQSMPPADKISALSELFKVFGDNTRLRIMFVLSQQEVCVYDLAVLLGMTQSAISHQLRILKQSRLVKSRRDGKMTFYSLDDDHVRSVISQGMEHVME